MPAASTMYQDLILDHNRSPRNYGRLPHANHRAEGNNPLCGDRLVVWLMMEGDRVQDVAFEASGCAISVASASLMTGAIKGKTRAEAELLFDRFRRLVAGEPDSDDAAALGKLAVFSGVRNYPLRVKCATLSWHAMKSALDAPEAQVTTD
jgi:nitrogen fixation NifU-like protein